MYQAHVNWYYYISTENGLHTIELEFINCETGVSSWKRFQHASKKKVYSIAAASETRFFKKLNTVYGN